MGSSTVPTWRSSSGAGPADDAAPIRRGPILKAMQELSRGDGTPVRRRSLTADAGVRSIVACVVVALFIAWAAPRACFAQGTRGIWGEPITTQEFERLVTLALTAPSGEGADVASPASPDDSLVGADPLDPRVRAWLTKLEPLHDAYLHELLAIRAQHAIPHLLEGREVMSCRSAAEARATFVRFESVAERRLDVERQFFDAIERELPSSSRAAVVTLRHARERARIPWVTAGLGGFDLVNLIDRLDLPSRERAAIAPVLRTYETRLLAIARELRKIRSDQIDDFVAAIGANATAWAAIQGDEFEVRQARTALVADAVAWTNPARLEKADAIQELNLSTLSALLPHLSKPARRAVQLRIVAEAVSEVGREAESADRLVARLLTREDLNDGVRTRLQELTDAWRATDDALMEEIIDAHAEADRMSTAATLDASFRDASHTAGNRFSGIDGERREKQRNFLRSVARTLGPSRAQRLGIVPLEIAQAREDPFAPSPIEVAEPPDFVADDEVILVDPEQAPAPPPPAWTAMNRAAQGFVRAGGFADKAEPLARVQLLEWVLPLELTADELAAVNARHSEYLDRWRREIEPLATSLVERLPKTTVSPMASEEEVAEALAAIDEVAELRRQLLPKIAAADGALFDSLAPIFAADDRRTRLNAMRVARFMAMFGATSGLGVAAMEEAFDHPLNLGAFALHVALPQAVSDEFLSALERHTASIREATLAQARAAIEWDAAWTRVEIHHQLAPEDEEAKARLVSLLQAEFEQSKANRSRRDVVRRLTHALGREVETKLGEVDRQTFLDAWYTVLFPNEAPDREDASMIIERIRTLPELSETERAEVERIAAEHRRRHRAATARIIEVLLSYAPPVPTARTTRAAESRESRRVTFERELWAFDRREANEKARMHLRTALTPADVARVPALSFEGIR